MKIIQVKRTEDSTRHIVELTEYDAYLLGYILRKRVGELGIQDTQDHVDHLLRVIDDIQSDY